MSEMTPEEIKEWMLRMDKEIYEKKNLDAADEIYSQDVVRHSPAVPEPIRGLEAWKERVREIQAAFPDVEISVEDIIVEENKAAQRWVMKGTHQGEFNGIPATGKQVTFTGINFARIEDGKVAEQWTEVNLLGLLQQLGVAPGPEQAPAD